MFKQYNDIEVSRFDETKYLTTGITKLDKLIVGLGLGQLVILSGARAGGKTTLLGQIVTNFNEKGYKGLLCSFEMTNSRLKTWLNLQALGKNNLKEEISTTGKVYYTPKDEEVSQKVSNWFSNNLEIYDNNSFNVNNISKDITAELERNPEIKYVILDNLMRIDCDTLSGDKWQAQAKLVGRLQKYAQEHNICLILVVHPNKIKVLPRIEDIGGSGDIINCADTVLLVHRVNIDFKIRAKEYFGWQDTDEVFKYSNLIEIAKDREFGEESIFVGTYFEPCAKRFLNYENENKQYSWGDKQITLTETDEFDDIF